MYKMPKKARMDLLLNANEVVLAANKQGLQYLAKWVAWMSKQKLDEAKTHAGIHFHLRCDNRNDVKNGKINFKISPTLKIHRKYFDFVIYGSNLVGMKTKQTSTRKAACLKTVI